MKAGNVIELKNVSKYYKLYNNPKDRLKESLNPFGKKYHKEFFALKNIDLEVNKGEILGVVGRNGAGKSTLLKLITGVLKASSGEIETKGNISALLELGAGFNPHYTGIENIYFYSSILGMSKEEIDEKLEDITRFADLGQFIHQPVKTYSSGMKARLGFAVATNIKPEILIVDEVLAVGDAVFRRKCFARMEELLGSGSTVLFVSHAEHTILSFCTKAMFLDKGNLIQFGDTKAVVENYLRFTNLSDKKREAEFVKELKETEAVNKTAEKIEAKKENIQEMFLDKLKIDATIDKSADIDLIDVGIYTMQGKKVNFIVNGRRHKLSFSLKFNEDIDKCFIPMQIKEEKGLVVSGTAFPIEKDRQISVAKGETIKVSWEFDCMLKRGDYTIQCGVQKMEAGEKNTLISISNLFLFRIVDDNVDSKNWGIFNIFEKEKFIRL